MILAVKMKVHKLLYFYWSSFTAGNDGGGGGGGEGEGEGAHISGERGLNDHRVRCRTGLRGQRRGGEAGDDEDKGAEGREQKQEVWQAATLLSIALINSRERKRAAALV